MVSVAIQREKFDSWKNLSTTKILTDKSQIKEVMDSFKACTIKSTLPCKTDKVSKYMMIYRKKGYYYTIRFSEDTVDARCRVFIFSKGKILVSWLGQTGELDFGEYKCVNGQPVLKLLRQLL